MPGTIFGADKLPQFAIAPYIKMGGNLQAFDAFEVGVLVPVQAVGEQLLYFIAPISSWRQTDRVDHDQINDSALGPWAKIR